jgi:hypothetical protein
LGILSKRIDETNKVLAAITESMKHIPSRRELRQYQATKDEELAQGEEINTGLTTAIEQYKFSKSTPFEFQQNAAGPSGTHQYTHPQRRPAFQSPSVSSLRDTDSASRWNFERIRGGAGDRCMSRRQRRIKELELAKPINIKEPKKFYRNAGEDFDTLWMLVQVYIEDQPEKFPKNE